MATSLQTAFGQLLSRKGVRPQATIQDLIPPHLPHKQEVHRKVEIARYEGGRDVLKMLVAGMSIREINDILVNKLAILGVACDEISYPKSGE